MSFSIVDVTRPKGLGGKCRQKIGIEITFVS